MEFVKWHGLGNDFVMIDCLHSTPDFYRQDIIKLCDRNIGIGADGLVLIEPAEEGVAEVTMRIFNADGTIAEMCGNATRCVAAYMSDRYGTVGRLRIQTLAGIKEAEVLDKNGRIAYVRVNMGIPELHRRDIGIEENPDGLASAIDICVADKKYRFTGISMGNPHIVTFVSELGNIDIVRLGPLLENYPLFTEKTNVEFAQLLSSQAIRMRVWERGVGITKACGTGSCATLAAAVLNGYVEKEADVILDGGILHISWDGVGEPIYMTGEATEVFSGTYYI